MRAYNVGDKVYNVEQDLFGQVIAVGTEPSWNSSWIDEYGIFVKVKYVGEDQYGDDEFGVESEGADPIVELPWLRIIG